MFLWRFNTENYPKIVPITPSYLEHWKTPVWKGFVIWGSKKRVTIVVSFEKNGGKKMVVYSYALIHKVKAGSQILITVLTPQPYKGIGHIYRIFSENI